MFVFTLPCEALLPGEAIKVACPVCDQTTCLSEDDVGGCPFATIVCNGLVFVLPLIFKHTPWQGWERVDGLLFRTPVAQVRRVVPSTCLVLEDGDGPIGSEWLVKHWTGYEPASSSFGTLHKALQFDWSRAEDTDRLTIAHLTNHHGPVGVQFSDGSTLQLWMGMGEGEGTGTDKTYHRTVRPALPTPGIVWAGSLPPEAIAAPPGAFVQLSVDWEEEGLPDWIVCSHCCCCIYNEEGIVTTSYSSLPMFVCPACHVQMLLDMDFPCRALKLDNSSVFLPAKKVARLTTRNVYDPLRTPLTQAFALVEASEQGPLRQVLAALCMPNPVHAPLVEMHMALAPQYAQVAVCLPGTSTVVLGSEARERFGLSCQWNCYRREMDADADADADAVMCVETPLCSPMVVAKGTHILLLLDDTMKEHVPGTAKTLYFHCEPDAVKESVFAFETEPSVACNSHILNLPAEPYPPGTDLSFDGATIHAWFEDGTHGFYSGD